jgi:hypothetical protein
MSDAEDSEPPHELDEQPAEVPSSQTIYGLLADRRRRYTIHYLKQRSEAVSLRELAEQVAAWENNKSVEALNSQERKRVYIALYQSHLPSMDREGIVEYDSDRGTVSLAEEYADIDIYLEVVPSDDVPWSVYYLGLAVANAVLLGLVGFEVAPFDTLPDLFWGFVVIATFAVSALSQTLRGRRMRFGDEGPPPELLSRGMSGAKDGE